MSRKRGRSLWLITGLLGAACCLHSEDATAQFGAQVVEWVDAEASGESDEDQTDGFGLPTNDETVQALADFDRHVNRRAWEKAFRALEEVSHDADSGMAPMKDGFVVPAQERIWQALVDLPAEGRDAYRVFFDAKAKQMMQSPADRTLGAQITDVEVARQVFDRYFLTSVGDNAADVLGDTLFQRGRYLEADRYWKAIFDHHHDSELSEVKLHTKRAIGLIRAGRTDQFDEIRQTIQRRFEGQRVLLGGEEVDPLELLQRLASRADAEALRRPVLPSYARPIGAPAEDAEPIWQVPFVSETLAKKLGELAKQDPWGGARSGLLGYVPPTATDGKRLFCNWLGVCFAVDLPTGKLVWRNEKFTELNEKLSYFQHSANVSQYAITAGEGTVLATLVPLGQLGHGEGTFGLVAYDAASGRELWSTRGSDPRQYYGRTPDPNQQLAPQAIRTASFLGRPLIHGDEVITVSHQIRAPQLVMRVLSLDDGSQRWALSLGNAKFLQNTYGAQVMPQPVLTISGDILYVLSNNGALLAIDLAERRRRWAFRFKPPANMESNPFGRRSSSGQATASLHPAGALIQYNGVLYFKESRGRTLYALDPIQRRVLWRRPVEELASLVGYDDELLYLLSNDLVAIDRTTRGMRWSIKLPVAAGGPSVLIGADREMLFTSRGVFELSKENGDVKRIFRGVDRTSRGGSIDLLADRVLCVSNLAITAYPAGVVEVDDEVDDRERRKSAP